MRTYLMDTSLGPCPMEPALTALCELLDSKFGEDGYDLETVSGCAGEDGLPYLAGEGAVRHGTRFREKVRLCPVSLSGGAAR
jgi:hypothetical protein